MDIPGTVAIAHSALVVAVMLSGAESDLRTRRVDDRHWMALCTAGVPLAAIGPWLSAGGCPPLLAIAGSYLLSWYMLSPRLTGMRAAVVLTPGIALMAAPALRGDMAPLVSCALFLTFALLYRFGPTMGGADAKCMMTLALVLPAWPDVPSLWGHGDLPPALSVTLLALVLAMLSAVPIAVRNIIEGHHGRGMLTTVEVDVQGADPERLWPVQRPGAGGLVACRGSPDTAREVFEELSEAGVDRVRATPSVPFIVPMAASLVLLLFLGSPFA